MATEAQGQMKDTFGSPGAGGQAAFGRSAARLGNERQREDGQRAQFDEEMVSVQELELEQQRAQDLLRDAMAGYIGVSQEVLSKVKTIEESEKRRREAEEGFAKAKPFSSTTLEERRQAAEICQLTLSVKLANDRACRLQIENSSLKDELKAVENMSPLSSMESDREVNMEGMKRLRRQVKTKETLCTTVINELEAVRKELLGVKDKRDQLSAELESVMQGAGAQAQAVEATYSELQARVNTLEEDKRKLLIEVWGDSGPQLSADGKPLSRKELVSINRQWEAAYNSLKQEFTKLKIRTADREGNPSSRRKKRVHSKKHTTKEDEDKANRLVSTTATGNAAAAAAAGEEEADDVLDTVRPPATRGIPGAAEVTAGSTLYSVILSHQLQGGLRPGGMAPAPTPLYQINSASNSGNATGVRPPSPPAEPDSPPANVLVDDSAARKRLEKDLEAMASVQADLSASQTQTGELHLHVARLQDALREKRTQLSEEKEQHQMTMAEKESLVTALSVAEKAKVASVRLEEAQRLRQELHTSIKSEQRLQRELEAMQATNRQDTVRLEEVHKELLRLSNDKRKLEADLLEATGRLEAIGATLINHRT